MPIYGRQTSLNSDNLFIELYSVRTFSFFPKYSAINRWVRRRVSYLNFVSFIGSLLLNLLILMNSLFIALQLRRYAQIEALIPLIMGLFSYILWDNKDRLAQLYVSLVLTQNNTKIK